MIVLVINAGSSSLKYQLIDMQNTAVLAKGNCDRIGIDGILSHTAPGKCSFKKDVSMKNHAEAVQVLIETLTSPECGVISNVSEISAVGHRIVHGGEHFTQAVLVDDSVMEGLNKCTDIAPLHTIPHITGIEACAQVIKNIPQVLVFDTAFHQTMPKRAYIYALPYEFYTKYHLRRYGFHGTSHKYVSQRALALMGRTSPKGTRLITCHLGNGSSFCAVKDGKSFDTSMGLTPLEGIMMGSRCGSVDPAILPFLIDKEGYSARDLNELMNKKSGALGVSGVSSDFRDLETAAEEGNERALLALEMFTYQAVKLIGSYIAAMDGVDAIIFTAGIGENNSVLRRDIARSLSFLNIQIDDEKNALRGQEVEISRPGSGVRVFVIPTNEELMIARETERLVCSLNPIEGKAPLRQ